MFIERESESTYETVELSEVREQKAENDCQHTPKTVFARTGHEIRSSMNSKPFLRFLRFFAFFCVFCVFAFFAFFAFFYVFCFLRFLRFLLFFCVFCFFAFFCFFLLFCFFFLVHVRLQHSTTNSA